MLTQQDVELLKWVSQRLVNRYGEDPAIILDINNIINRVISERTTYNDLTKTIKTSGAIIISKVGELVDFTNKIPQIIRDQTVQRTIEMHTNTFDNINIDELFK